MTTGPPGNRVQPLDQPIVCPVLIGRDPHLDALRRCVDDARTGHGRVVLVSGEAGIGKSRLVAETSAQARRNGARLLEGHCFEPDRVLPYAPLQDLLLTVPIAHSPEAIIDSLGPAAYDLEPIIPALADWLPAARQSAPLGLALMAWGCPGCGRRGQLNETPTLPQ